MPDEQRRRTEDESASTRVTIDTTDAAEIEPETSPIDASSGDSESDTSDAESTGAIGTPGLIQPIEFSPDGVPKHVATAFWTVVVVVNAAILALSLGPMLIFFEGRWLLGGGLIVLGVALSGLAYWRYREFRREQAERAEAEDDEDDEDEDKVFSVVPERGLPGLDDRATARTSETEDASESTRNR